MAKIDLGFSCRERWTEMEVRAGGRHCGACKEHVVDLSRLTLKQAVRVIEQRDAPCVSFEVDARGEVLFRREPRRAPGLLAAGAASLLAACVTDRPTYDLERDPITECAPLEPAPAAEAERAAQVMALHEVGASSPLVTDTARAGDENDTDGVDPLAHRPRATPAAAVAHHRYAGRRPSIAYTRRDRNL